MLERFLPDIFEGWTAEKPLIMTAPADLYQYIDGGAELYLSYGFREAVSRTYKKEGQPEVVAEVYDLNEPRNAFGVFTQAREEETTMYGQGTYLLPGAVFFWKDHYYITLSTWEQSHEALELINSLAARINSMIVTTGELPAVISLLPAADLVQFGYRYFHHYVWINSFFFISDHNVLNIDATTDAVLAKYAEGEGRMHLLLVLYKDAETAQVAYETFSSAFFPEGLTNSCIRLEDNTWMSAKHTGKLFAAVFNSLSCNSAINLIDAAIKNYHSINH